MESQLEETKQAEQVCWACVWGDEAQHEALHIHTKAGSITSVRL